MHTRKHSYVSIGKSALIGGGGLVGNMFGVSGDTLDFPNYELKCYCNYGASPMLTGLKINIIIIYFAIPRVDLLYSLIFILHLSKPVRVQMSLMKTVALNPKKLFGIIDLGSWFPYSKENIHVSSNHCKCGWVFIFLRSGGIQLHHLNGSSFLTCYIECMPV